MKQRHFYLLIIFLFIFRILYGLCSEFWFVDELQIYLIGLKSFTTGTWPFYGPDIIYTNTQIPGALQGLLVSAPFYLSKIPEAPIVFLNILSFSSLSLLAWYISKRITGIPKWLIWTLILTLPWTMYYSTRVVNPSYVLVFSIPFFLSVIDLLPIYKEKLIAPKLAFFIMGLATSLIMQLHLSFVLLLPYSGFIFLGVLRKTPKKFLLYSVLYVVGILVGLSTVIPTWLHPDPGMESTASNVVFNFSNIKNIFTILFRFLSFATFDIVSVLGGSTAERLNVIKSQIWMSPFAIVLLVAGFLQIGLFIFSFFLNKEKTEWQKIKWLTFFSWLLIFLSFFFSIKGPSAHTFYLMLPIPVIYSFYCYQWLVSKKNSLLKYLKIIALCGIFFHIGAGIYNYQHKSLYVNRNKVEEALKKMDHTILGTRRAATWGYGY